MISVNAVDCLDMLTINQSIISPLFTGIIFSFDDSHIGIDIIVSGNEVMNISWKYR